MATQFLSLFNSPGSVTVTIRFDDVAHVMNGLRVINFSTDSRYRVTLDFVDAGVSGSVHTLPGETKTFQFSSDVQLAQRLSTKSGNLIWDVVGAYSVSVGNE